MVVPYVRARAVRAVPAVRAGLAALAVVVLAVVGTVVAVTATSAAVPQSRSVEPFMAGTAIQSATDRCTAGLVLKDNSALGGITEYRRSVRFILTVGHCGAVGDAFSTPAGYSVGSVVWKSSVHDLMLIRVEPRLDRGIAPGCRPGSSNLPCVAISSHYYPRAVGRVFTGGPGVSDNVPVNGTTMSGEPVFISGAMGGAVGGHTGSPRPPGMQDPPNAQDRSFTRGSTNGIGPGDSGAPLFSHNGNVFGIFKSTWRAHEAGAGVIAQGVSYTKVSVFLAEQGGYALAPPEV